MSEYLVVGKRPELLGKGVFTIHLRKCGCSIGFCDEMRVNQDDWNQVKVGDRIILSLTVVPTPPNEIDVDRHLCAKNGFKYERD